MIESPSLLSRRAGTTHERFLRPSVDAHVPLARPRRAVPSHIGTITTFTVEDRVIVPVR